MRSGNSQRTLEPRLLTRTDHCGTQAACLHESGPDGALRRVGPVQGDAGEELAERHVRKLYTVGELPQRAAWNG